MPSPRDTFLRNNQDELIQLAQHFTSYPANITKSSIENFILQFDDTDLLLALKLLQNIEFYEPSRMMDLSRQLGLTIHSLNGGTFDNVIFCPLSTTSGDSAEGILRNLRMTLTGRSTPRITTSNYVNVITDLSKPKFTEDTTNKKIVFIDHFIGSGDTIIGRWIAIQQWLNDNHDYYVGVLVAYEDAIRRVEEETFSRFNVVSMVQLPKTRRAFDEGNTIFTNEEKEKLKQYCDNLNISEEHRYGHRNGQSLVIFSNRVSNNVLPILHYETENWKPLFPRLL